MNPTENRKGNPIALLPSVPVYPFLLAVCSLVYIVVGGVKGKQ